MHRAPLGERVHGALGFIEHGSEWPTLVFFPFLFIVVGAGVEPGRIAPLAGSLAAAIDAGRSSFALGPEGTLLFAALLILWAAAGLSALIDNIPFVAVSIPILHELIPTVPPRADLVWWALAPRPCLGRNPTPTRASTHQSTLPLPATRPRP